MDKLWQDLRYGVRLLTRSYGFTLIAILTLALGIGANTAIFSVVNALLLKPLPFKDPDRLMALFETTSKDPQNYISYPNLVDYRAQNKVFEDLCTIVPQTVNLTGLTEPDRVRGGFVTTSFFKVLDLQPAQGRLFSNGEDQTGAERVAILNDNLWQRRFGGDTGIVGKSIILNGDAYTVVGIMPASFQFPYDEVEIWIPISHYPNFKLDRAAQFYFAFGRLKPGIDPAQATAELNTIAANLAQAYPDENRGRGVMLQTLKEVLVERLRPSLLILLAAVALILLIACANIANLLLARGAARQKEIAVRAALGASRARLLQQLLTETMLLGLVGGLLGLILALWGVDLLRSLLADQLPAYVKLSVDARVLGYTSLLSLGTGLLFGFVPALQLSKPDLNNTLKESSRGSSEGRGQRLRAGFVIAQVALSLVLLIGAGLLIKSFYLLVEVNPGFNPEQLLTMEYRLPRNKYPKPEAQWNFHREVVERVRELPGVKSVAVVRGLPFSGNGGSGTFILPDRPAPAKGEEPQALINTAGPGYFETIGIPLYQGRSFTSADQAESAPVILINQTMAKQYWPSGDALGKQLKFTNPDRTATIVGIVGDARQYDLGESQRSQIYACYSQFPDIFATLVVRTEVEPMSLSRAVRERVWSVDKDQPVWKVRTVASLIGRNIAGKQLVVALMGIFAAIALLLAIIGIYGVISYSVNQRTHEIGIRMALGAQQRDIFKMIVGQGLVLTGIGIVIGLIGSLALTRFLAGLLYGISTTDPVTFVTVAALLLMVALLAAVIPARRATRVDPMVALRYE